MILECVPEEQFSYKPHEKSMSLVSSDFKAWSAASKAELLEKFDANIAAARMVLAEAADEDYMTPWTMTWGGHKVFDATRIVAIRSFIMNHTIHHRGRLTVYLRLLNIPFPGVYGPSATDHM